MTIEALRKSLQSPYGIQSLNTHDIERAIEEFDAIREVVKDLSGAMLSVNRGSLHKISIDGDDEPCFWQRSEWIKWIIELATEARKKIEVKP